MQLFAVFIVFIVIWLLSRHWSSACALLLLLSLSGFGDSCSSKSEKEKLDEWRKLAKLHRQDTEENIINQSNSGVSLFNFQWASFASGASPSELLCSSVDQSSSVVSGKPRLVEDGARIRSVCLPPSAPSVPPQVAHHLKVGPQSPPPMKPLSLEPTGSAPRQDGLLFPHHTLSDPVAFRGSRFPSSRHFYTTGISPDVDIPPVEERLSRCGLSQLSLSTEDHCLSDSRKSGMSSTSGPGGTSPGLPTAAPPPGVSLLSEPERLPRPSLQKAPGDKGTEPVSNLLATSSTDNYRLIPRESVSNFNDCKSSVSGNIFNMKVRF